MKIIQVHSDYVLEHLNADNIYRIMLCDDTKATAGKKHYSARIKPLKTMNIYELTASVNSPDYGFVLIEGDNNAI